jgi:ssDNA-binding Zn-finger/Zn-ribbon topoisomerase 1
MVYTIKIENNMTESPNICPRCGKPLETRKGTYGTYLDCTDYPKCKYTHDVSSKNVGETTQIGTNTPSLCPKCGKKLALYIGKYGIFLGCNGYPTCNYSQNFEDPYNITCPKCGKIMKERTGAYGRFYGCRGYPKCKFTFNLRVKGKTQEKKQSKKLVLPEGYGFGVTGDDILGALTRGGQNLRELVNKLELTDEVDIKYLKLKLKEFENKGLVVKNYIENETIWEKTK